MNFPICPEIKTEINKEKCWLLENTKSTNYYSGKKLICESSNKWKIFTQKTNSKNLSSQEKELMKVHTIVTFIQTAWPKPCKYIVTKKSATNDDLLKQ